MTEEARERRREVGDISRRAAAWLAWSLCAASLTLLVAGATLSYLRPPIEDIPLWLLYPLVIGFAAYPVVGALVASRRPNNAIGWLLCVVGLAITTSIFSDEYASYAQQVQPSSLPGAEVIAFLSTINPGLVLAIFVLLLFPEGRLPSRRWRPLVWLAGGATVLLIVYGALDSGRIEPLGVDLPSSVVEAIWTVDVALIIASILGAALSLLVRLRRSGGAERQQVKWLVYAASVAAVGILGAVLPPPMGDIFWVVTNFGFAAMAVAIGVAVLRYGLYEIDLIINRTLVYGSLTVMLALMYFGGVTATQAIYRTLSGQEQQPQLAIVFSTLVIAALFTPLRRRIQAFIDRRFYRKKYDAAKTLEAFSAKLRDETDLDALRDDLMSVVRESMQPAHVSLWLRPQGRGERRV